MYRNHHYFLRKETVAQTCPPEPHPDQNCILKGYDSSGCCQVYECNPAACVPVPQTVTLRKNDCEASITLNSCKGRCDSSTIFNPETGRVEPECGCCLPKESRKMTANLICKNGKRKYMDYILFVKCECKYDVCKLPKK
eukprot:gi/632985875/ref/XP_007909925.1/ PREDICTED: integumentary mucin B.1-like [Callorhinchus milii]